MGLVAVLGVVLIVVGGLALLSVISISTNIAILVVVAGVLMVVFGSGRFPLRRD